ncbi:MAG: enoyl-CoA hydratase/isomerase family protein [Desulfatibacillum sp.]|nr:enoyl-CoA hydratase/isomerase family protein [Desulfatibacillum sp.]
MSFENLITEKGEDFVGMITLNRPEQLNTFSWDLARELKQALGEMENDPAIRVVMVTGAGRAFCAGIDLTGYEGKSTSEYEQWVGHMEEPLVFIGQMSKPVIAKVNGAAAAIGAGLVAAADLAIASEKARIGLTAINVGLNCVGPVIPVARTVGRKQALEMLLFGEMIDPKRALEMGLYNRVVPSDDLDKKARDWAAALAQRSPVAVANAKTAFYASEDMAYADQFKYMNQAFAQLCSSDAAKEGVAAFLEKRNPSWKTK